MVSPFFQWFMVLEIGSMRYSVYVCLYGAKSHPISSTLPALNLYPVQT